MNERIKELLKQATKTLNVKHEGYRGKGYTEQVEFFDKEKFAELIIKETLMVARVGMELGPSMAEAVYSYFGVEE